MKFGSVDHPGEVDFTLPPDPPETERLLSRSDPPNAPDVYVGCAKWNRKDLKGFYPRGVGDELEYYASQFNAIELNTTFYRIYDPERIGEWRGKVPGTFRFFPKVNGAISHRKWLNGFEEAADRFIGSIEHFEDRLGTTFLQMNGRFAPKFFDRVASFLAYWPDQHPLALELRHPDWYADPEVANALCELLEDHGVAHVITDTAGRRDLLHMRLTNGEAFIRYVGANHPTDRSPLDDWVERLAEWTEQGLRRIHFFVHQNEERESPELSAYFIRKLNEAIGSELKPPRVDGQDGQQDLFS